MKLKVVWRKLYDYVRYDLKEIAFPSSLPDPPHIKKRRKLTWEERFCVLKEASRLYAASWVRDIGPDLRPNDYKKDKQSADSPGEAKATDNQKEPSTLEDLAVAARGGMETLRPALQRVYMTRASAYRDALKSFIQGYQEGIQQVMEAKEDAKPKQQEDGSRKSIWNPAFWGSMEKKCAVVVSPKWIPDQDSRLAVKDFVQPAIKQVALTFPHPYFLFSGSCHVKSPPLGDLNCQMSELTMSSFTDGVTSER